MIRLLASICIASCAILVSTGCSTSPPSDDTHTPPTTLAPPRDPPSTPAEQNLARKIDAHLQGEPLHKALDWFRHEAAVNIVVNEAALEAAGVEMDAPVKLSLSQVRASKVLALILDSVCGDASLEPIEFSVEDNAVHISTQRDLYRRVVARSYDIVDLLVVPPMHWTTIDVARMSVHLSRSGNEAEPITREELIEQITTLIQDTVGTSGDWAADSDEISSLREFANVLHIRATRSRHREIEALLADLRGHARRNRIHNEREKEIAHWLGEANRSRLQGDDPAARAFIAKARHVLPDHPVAVAMTDLLDRIAKGKAGKPAATTSARSIAFTNSDEHRSRLAAEDREAWNRLARPISVEFNKTKLIDALRQVAQRAQVNLYISWKSLESAGIEPGTPVTLNLKRVPAEAVLRSIVSVTPGVQVAIEPVSFDVSEGVVIVDTKRGLQRDTHERTYDITDILAYPIDPLGIEALRPNSAEAGKRHNSEQPLTRDEWVDEIATLIQDHVGEQPDWAAYGGQVSTLRELNGMLIIKTRPTNHAEIGQILADLRGRCIDHMTRQLAQMAIAPLLTEADQLRLADRHEEALKRIDKALIIRPDHPDALAVRTVLMETIARKKGQ